MTARTLTRCLFLIAALSLATVSGCADDASTEADASDTSVTGGATTGGASTGGASTGGTTTGGTTTGGAPTGGTTTGGAPTGGAPTGGAPTGGAPTGGAPTGGMMMTGGAPTGGMMMTGGAPTGGMITGGMAMGGMMMLPPLACDTPFMPCGGDATGSWDIVDFCFEGSTFDPTSICAQATGMATLTSTTGNLTLNGDGTYTTNSTLVGSFDINVPASCLTPPLTCMLLGTNLAPQGGSCVTMGTDCLCSIPINTTSMDAGTWVQKDMTTITTTDGTTGNMTDVEYCVMGGGLVIRNMVDPMSGDVPTRIQLSRTQP